MPGAAAAVFTATDRVVGEQLAIVRKVRIQLGNREAASADPLSERVKNLMDA